MSTDQSSTQGCVACKRQKRRCREDCLLKPYFRSNSSQEAEVFESAQRVFGISNMNKILRQVRVEDRAKPVESIVWEASIWKRDHVNGPLGQYKRFQQENTFLETRNNFLLPNWRNFTAPQLGFQELNNNGVGVLPNPNINIVARNFQHSGGLRPQIMQGQGGFWDLNGLQGFQRGNFGVSRQNFDNGGLMVNRVRGIRDIQYPVSHHNQNQFGGEFDMSNLSNVKFYNTVQFPNPTQQLQGLYDNDCIQGKKEVMSTDQSSKQGCLACKHQRRRCREDCLLKHYFRSNNSQEAEDFQSAQKIFGISNMNKILKQIRVEDRPKAIESLVWEASIWKQDPVNGPLGQFKLLQKENTFLKTQNNILLQNLRNLTAPQLGVQELNNNEVGVLPNHNINIVAGNFQHSAGLQGQDRFGCLNGLQGFERGNLGVSRQSFDNGGLVVNGFRGVRDIQYPVSHHNQNQFGGEIDMSNLNNVKFHNMVQFPNPTQQLQGLHDNYCIQGQSSNAIMETAGDQILPISTTFGNCSVWERGSMDSK